VKDFDWETCQKAAMFLKKLSSVRLSTMVMGDQEEFDFENAVKCLQAFVNNGKLRSASFKITKAGARFEDAKLWRQKLMQHPQVKKWSKVTRVRCNEQCFFFAQATFVHVQKVPKNFLHRKIFFVPSKNVFLACKTP